jgi:hypothetical protein
MRRPLPGVIRFGGLLVASLLPLASPLALLGGAALGVVIVVPSVAGAQVPPPVLPIPLPVPVPDTLRAADTLTVADPTGAEPGVVPDTVPLDTARQVLPRNVPQARIPLPAGVEQGVWEWDRQALLAASALTLHDLLSFVPGMTMVRGGDVGAPVGVSAFGAGGGQVRVFLDGVEDAPLESGVVDLALVGMTGLERVRVERGPAEVRIHLTTHQVDDPRPFTLLDVATGDLRTNVFRAGFVHPDAFGGTLLVALDRTDSDGPLRAEPGAAFGTRFRYSLFPAEGLGVAFEYRSRTARRPVDTYQPAEVGRSELSARLGWEVSESLNASMHVLRSRASLGDRAEPAADSLLPGEARGSVGGRVVWQPEGGPVGAWVGASRHSGEGWPLHRMEAGVTGSLEGIGGVSARVDREGWSDQALTGRESDLPAATGAGMGWSVRGWSAARAGVSLFAEAEHARRGMPFVVPSPRIPPPEEGDPGTDPGNANDDEATLPEPEAVPFDPVGFFGRDGLRAGARFQRGGVDLSAAWIRVEADFLPPLGLPFDRGGVTLPGGVRNGFEVEGRLPLSPLLSGLALSGTGQFWGAGGEEAWRYLPERTWTGQLNWFHEGYDGNLEVWADVGVRGRDPMAVPVSDGLGGVDGALPGEAPFTQSWFARLQFRVVTVRVFIHWENFTFRPDNADLPDRLQPQTRVMYGVRWTMWN